MMPPRAIGAAGYEGPRRDAQRPRVIPLRDDNPVERTPIVTYTLLVLNVLAFGWQLGLPGTLAAPDVFAAMQQHLADSVVRGGVDPYAILTLSDTPRHLVRPPFTILTSMFLHGGPGHLAFNMLFLWIFGNNVEDALGRLRFVAFYVGVGILAALTQVVASAVSGDLRVHMVGASGAISGVLAAYMVLFPRSRVMTLVFVFVVPLPAIAFIGIWFLFQVRAVIFGGEAGVAVFAHIGGFVSGLLLVRWMQRRPGWRARRRAYW
jgi:membrane associated rhomboid family serine protease